MLQKAGQSYGRHRIFHLPLQSHEGRSITCLALPDFFYGSIAVNEFGDVVIGFNGSGPSQFVSSYAVQGTTVSGITTFGEPLLLQAGVANYAVLQIFDSGRNRWGDYSATVVDPTDPFTFWTFQEWVSANNTWATQITQLRVAGNLM